MSDDDYEAVAIHRRAVSSGEPSLAGSGDEDRALSDTEISKVLKKKELASQVKGPSSDELEIECEKSRIQATKDEIAEEKLNDFVSFDDEGFEDALGGGDFWKKTIKEGHGDRGAPQQWVEIRVKDLSKDADNDDVTEIKFPLGYHYAIDAWELAVQSMLPGEICLIKCIPRLVNGNKASFAVKKLIPKYEIELKSLGKFVNFDEMSHEEKVEFLTTLKDRASWYFDNNMLDHAIQLNGRALDIISKEFDNSKDLNEIRLELTINAATYLLKNKDASEGLRHVKEGLTIDSENEKLLYKQSQFHFMKKEFKETKAILSKLIAKGINNEVLADDLHKANECVKEQLEKEKQVYKRMFGPIGRPPRKQQQHVANGLSPTRRYLILASTVVILAVGFQFFRYYFDIHYFRNFKLY